jgi:hypothetical protein
VGTIDFVVLAVVLLLLKVMRTLLILFESLLLLDFLVCDLLVSLVGVMGVGAIARHIVVILRTMRNVGVAWLWRVRNSQ